MSRELISADERRNWRVVRVDSKSNDIAIRIARMTIGWWLVGSLWARLTFPLSLRY